MNIVKRASVLCFVFFLEGGLRCVICFVKPAMLQFVK